MEFSLPKIGIVGYGKMGKEIELVANNRGFEITEIFDIDKQLSKNEKYKFDVAIEFTQANSVIENIQTLCRLHKSVVIGTTGWQSQINEIKDLVLSNGIGCVYSSNFSVGVQIFFRIIRQASKILNKTEGYDIMVHELHHSRKKDSPSGTALTLGNIILNEIDFKKIIDVNRQEGQIANETLHISSTRGGEITGTHTIYIDSAADTIELTHRAKNRSGFALGALMAARWIYGKKGFFEFSEVLEDVL